jgi:putative chitinase
MITAEQLAACTGARIDRAQQNIEAINGAMAAYGITTPQRQAMFLANIGHESGGLRFPVELWGPTAAQSRYEGRTDLGNIHLGDGARFKGRGWLQTTGRNNYRRLTDRLRQRLGAVVPDFESTPDDLAKPEWCAMSAADYWGMRGLNAVADADDFDGVCDVINLGHKTRSYGDSNGFAERARLYEAAKAALFLT